MAARQHHAQEQFLHLDNYRSERDKPTELEIFPEEVRAEIVDVLEASPRDVQYTWEIEPLESDAL